MAYFFAAKPNGMSMVQDKSNIVLVVSFFAAFCFFSFVIFPFFCFRAREGGRKRKIQKRKQMRKPFLKSIKMRFFAICRSVGLVS
jgi:hypothetical protein